MSYFFFWNFKGRGETFIVHAARKCVCAREKRCYMEIAGDCLLISEIVVKGWPRRSMLSNKASAISRFYRSMYLPGHVKVTTLDGN